MLPERFRTSSSSPHPTEVFPRVELPPDVFQPAARAAGLDGLVLHELRHTAASLAIASGADVKVVQQMLGHKSATMTLDLDGHLFPDCLDEVNLDARRNGAVPQ